MTMCDKELKPFTDKKYDSVFDAIHPNDHEAARGAKRYSGMLLSAYKEIDRLNKLAYLVDQRNEDGEGNTITYKDAYESSSELASNLRKQVKALTEENEQVKKERDDALVLLSEIGDKLERCSDGDFGLEKFPNDRHWKPIIPRLIRQIDQIKEKANE